MLKKRFPRFLLLILISGGVVGLVYLLKLVGLFDTIFPNIQRIEGFDIWMPLLPPIAICVLGQFLGDILNVEFLNGEFFTWVKRILFLGATIGLMFWYAYSFETDYSIAFLNAESSFLSLGFGGVIFVFLAYVLAYIFWIKKMFYPFFLPIAVLASFLVDLLFSAFWPDGSFWLILAVAAAFVILFFAMPDERIFEEYSDKPCDPKKVAEDLAYFDDPDLRPGFARDYDENGYYFGASCSNCVYYKPFRDQNGYLQGYCALKKEGCEDHDSCDNHRRAK